MKPRIVSVVAIALLGVGWTSRTAAAAPLTLSAALTEARSAAPDLVTAKARVGVANAGFASANKLVATNPTLSLGYATGAPFGDEDRMWSFGISQTIEIGGQQGLRRAIVEGQVDESAAEEARMRNELLSDVVVGFYGLDSARRTVAVESEIVTAYESLLAIARTNLEKGVGTKLDVLTLEMETGRLRADLVASKAIAEALEVQLAALLGRMAGTKIEPSTEEVPVVATLDASALVAKGLANRPEIAAARARKRVFGSEGTLARREVWLSPTIGVGIQDERMAFGLGGFRLAPGGVPGLLGIDEHRTALTVSLSIPLPFFNPNSTAVAKSAAGLDLASAEERAATTKIEAEVRAAVLIAKGAGDAFAIHEKTRPATTEAGAAYLESFEKRQIGLGEALLGQERVLRARLQYLTSRSNFLRAKAIVDRAIGAWAT